MADHRGHETRLEGGPRHGEVYYAEDFKDRILAARRMGRTDPINDPAAWALGYEETGRGWIWRGRNCYPEPLNE